MSFTIGSMYWVNPRYSQEEFFEDMRRVRDNRITLLRIFVLWEYVEIEKGRYEFGMYDRFFRAAEAYGIGVMPTLIFYLPFHRVVEQSASGEGDGTRRVPCLDRPSIRQGLAEFASAVVSRYKDSPSLRLWNLWNEPADPVCTCAQSLEAFAGWLRRKYPTLSSLEESWAGEYYIFRPILPQSMEDVTGEWLSRVLSLATRGRHTGLLLDWHEFQTEHSAEHMAFLAELVRRHDTVHPTHSNPAYSCSSPVASGISVWKLAEKLDSVSASIHPHNYFLSLEPDRNRYPAAMLNVMDLVRSWAPGKDAWIGEYQAGATSFTKCTHYTPRVADIDATLLHALARGLRGVVFWEWQAWRQSIFEVGEFSLRNPSDGGETERSRAVRRIGAFVEEHTGFLSDVRPRPADVAVLHSLDQFILEYELEKNNYLPGWRQHHFAAGYACHQACVLAGIGCDYITESQLDDGMLSRYRVVILPNVQTVSARTAQWLRAFVEQGGGLWADGRCGWLDKHAFLRQCVPANGLDAVFGCREADQIAPREGDCLTCRGGGAVPAFRAVQRLAPMDGAEVVADCGGWPAAVRNRLGKGIAELWGTCIAGNPDGDVGSVLLPFVTRCGVFPDIRIYAGKQVFASLASGRSGMLAVFTSMAGESQRVLAELPRIGRLEEPCGDAELDGRRLRVTLGAGETVALLVRESTP